MQFFVQDTSETIEYQMNWEEAIGDLFSIADSSWLIPSPLVSDTPLIDGGFTAVKISGGVNGQRYQITNTVILSDGQQYSESIFIYFERK